MSLTAVKILLEQGIKLKRTIYNKTVNSKGAFFGEYSRIEVLGACSNLALLRAIPVLGLMACYSAMLCFFFNSHGLVYTLYLNDNSS